MDSGGLNVVNCAFTYLAALAAVIVGNYLTRYGFRTPLIVVTTGAAIACDSFHDAG